MKDTTSQAPSQAPSGPSQLEESTEALWGLPEEDDLDQSIVDDDDEDDEENDEE